MSEIQRARRIVRDWWPVPALVAAGIAAQSLWTRQYDVKGHAAAHLQSATAIFAGTTVLAVIFWALPRGRRFHPELWVCAALLIAGQFVVLRANVQVINAIGGENWSDDQADALGATRAGFEAGHTLANRGAWIAVSASILLALALARRHLVSWRVGIAAVVVSLVVPSFIAPGFGIVVLAVSVCTRKARGVHSSTHAE